MILKGTPEWRQRHAGYQRKRHQLNPKLILYTNAKARAKEKNLDFNIEMEDIVIPLECPILKVPMEPKTYYKASLDRIKPELGYVKGNIQVISHKANAMKQNASIEELKKFAEWASQLKH